MLIFFGILADVPDRILILLIFLVIWPLISIGGALLGGYLLSPLYLLLHKKILGNKLVYGIEERPQQQEFDKTWRGLFPALMAISLTIMLLFNESIQNLISGGGEGLSEIDVLMNTFIILLTIFIFVSIAIFGGIWFLLDAGIVYSNKDKVENKDQPIENKSVGGFYKILLKGYAGIGAAIAYYELVIFIMSILIHGFDPMIFLVLVFYIPFPIYASIILLPAIILLDIMKQNRINYVRKRAAKLGITDYVELTFTKIEK